MTFINANNAQVCVGQYDLTSYFTSVNPSLSQAMLDSTVFGDTGNKFTPGVSNGLISATGFYDDFAAGSTADNVLISILNLSPAPIVSAAPQGFAVGNRVYMLQAHVKNYNLSIKAGALIGNMADWQSTDGLDAGVSLHALTAETVSTNTASVDNSAPSTNGGVAFIHATLMTGTPSVVVKIQHSANNSTWGDIVVFSAIGATPSTSERIVVAKGTTILRYLRVISTFTGGTSPSVTYTVGFARR